MSKTLEATRQAKEKLTMSTAAKVRWAMARPGRTLFGSWLIRDLCALGMELPAAPLIEPFCRRFPSRDHLPDRPTLVAHPLQIAHQLMTHLVSQHSVVGAL